MKILFRTFQIPEGLTPNTGYTSTDIVNKSVQIDMFEREINTLTAHFTDRRSAKFFNPV